MYTSAVSRGYLSAMYLKKKKLSNCQRYREKRPLRNCRPSASGRRGGGLAGSTAVWPAVAATIRCCRRKSRPTRWNPKRQGKTYPALPAPVAAVAAAAAGHSIRQLPAGDATAKPQVRTTNADRPRSSPWSNHSQGDEFTRSKVHQIERNWFKNTWTEIKTRNEPKDKSCWWKNKIERSYREMLGKRVERERELRRVGSSTVGSDGRTDETSSDQPPSDQVGLHATAMVGSAPIGSSPDRQAGLVLVASQPNYPLPAPNQSPNSAHPIRSRPMAGDLRRPQEEPIMFSLSSSSSSSSSFSPGRILSILHPLERKEEEEERKNLRVVRERTQGAAFLSASLQILPVDSAAFSRKIHTKHIRFLSIPWYIYIHIHPF